MDRGSTIAAIMDTGITDIIIITTITVIDADR
jgi:hypothetical protein